MAKLAPHLANHTIIGLDTNPFIYLFESHPRYFPLVQELFSYLKSPQVTGVTSIITLIETCVLPQRNGRTDLVETYERVLLNSQQVNIHHIDIALAKHATRLRAQYNIRVPDALQLSAALENSATLFITNDRRLQKITDLSVLILDDYV